MHTTKVLKLTAVVEAATGLALMADPGLVVTLLLGAELSGEFVALGRVAGVALFALGLACWPERQGSQAKSDAPAFRAMLTYNALVGFYLAYLGAVAHQAGVLLWPAAVLHVAVAIVLVWTARNDRQTR